jgi:hypothetical protein
MATVSVSVSVTDPSQPVIPNGLPTVSFSDVGAGEYQVSLTNVFGILVSTLTLTVAADTPAVDPNATTGQ